MFQNIQISSNWFNEITLHYSRSSSKSSFACLITIRGSIRHFNIIFVYYFAFSGCCFLILSSFIIPSSIPLINPPLSLFSSSFLLQSFPPSLLSHLSLSSLPLPPFPSLFYFFPSSLFHYLPISVLFFLSLSAFITFLFSYFTSLPLHRYKVHAMKICVTFAQLATIICIISNR